MLRGTPLEGLKPYDLRHTAAMRLLQRTDLRTAAEIMRHSPQMLLEKYARSRRELKLQAIASF
jgi:integrase